MGEEAFYVMTDDASHEHDEIRSYAKASQIPYVVVDKNYHCLVTPQQGVKMENKWGGVLALCAR